MKIIVSIFLCTELTTFYHFRQRWWYSWWTRSFNLIFFRTILTLIISCSSDSSFTATFSLFILPHHHELFFWVIVLLVRCVHNVCMKMWLAKNCNSFYMLLSMNGFRHTLSSRDSLFLISCYTLYMYFFWWWWLQM